MTLSGVITDAGGMGEGETIRIPFHMSGHYSNTDFSKASVWGFPATLSNSTGVIVFTVSADDGNLYLTRTAFSVIGEFRFTLESALNDIWLNRDSEKTFHATTTTVTIGNSSATFANDPVSNKINDECHYALNHPAWNTIDAGWISSCNANQMFQGKTVAAAKGDVIIHYHITPVVGNIGRIDTDVYLGVPLAYDAQHAGSVQLLSVNVPVTAKDLLVTSTKQAQQLLKPGEQSLHRNSDGSYDIAYNLGAVQGDRAIMPEQYGVTGFTTWDATTNSMIAKSREKRLTIQDRAARLIVRAQDPDKPFIAQVRVAKIYDGDANGPVRELTVKNAPGSQQGASQTSLAYDGNGADSGKIEGKTENPFTTVKTANNAYTRNGYRFTGWNTKADGTGVWYLPSGSDSASGSGVGSARKTFTLPDGGANLYAQWRSAPVALPQTGGARGWVSLLAGGALFAAALLFFVRRVVRRI